MLEGISIWKFTQIFSLYVLASLAIYFVAANTIPAALAYSFIIAPFYLACIIYLIKFSLKHRQNKIRYQNLALWLSVISQFLIIFTSPASCYGWKQGEACYSFIQTHLTKNSFNSLQNTVPHWSIVESMFFVTLALHMIAIVAFLKTVSNTSRI
jgi:hypothetical protein